MEEVDRADDDARRVAILRRADDQEIAVPIEGLAEVRPCRGRARNSDRLALGASRSRERERARDAQHGFHGSKTHGSRLLLPSEVPATGRHTAEKGRKPARVRVDRGSVARYFVRRARFAVGAGSARGCARS
jgi:hypothetical protein